jgi:uridine kinase
MNDASDGPAASALDRSSGQHRSTPAVDAARADLLDVVALARSPLLAGLDDQALGAVLARLGRSSVAAGTVLARAGDPDDALTFVLEGSARVVHRGSSVAVLGPGACFGERVLAGAAVHPATVTAESSLRVARLGRSDLDALERTAPRVALHLVRALLRRSTTEHHAFAGLPPGEPDGRSAGELLAREHDGAPVVGAVLAGRAISLGARVPIDAGLVPLTTRSWIGRDIFRRSAGLLLLEAAVNAELPDLCLGPSITTGRVVTMEQPVSIEIVAALSRAMRSLIEDDACFVEETWSVDAAIAMFEQQGWSDAAALLGSWREPTIQLVRCGALRALATGPMLPRTGMLDRISIAPYPRGLLLDYGEPIRGVLARRPVDTLLLEQKAPRYGAEMTRAERPWLRLLGATSVGAFNRACISGRLREIVHASEAYHEKHIAKTADEVAERGDVRVILVAGPSSSGKTTFIKRLKVQLQVNGLHPVELSLDDYYKGRAEVARGPDGEQDFEALEALDLKLLDDHVGRILSGERVTTARFDFVTGVSLPAGGPEVALGTRDILLVEGIHGLNPGLLGDEHAGVFRLFVHVATSLPFDHLSWLEPADVRLVRRIVRDRHRRGTSTADSLARWTSVRRGERLHIHPFQGNADRIFDSSLVYEAAVLKVFAERYLLEVPREHPELASAERLRRLLDPVVPIHPDHVPPTSILREFIGSSGFSY